MFFCETCKVTICRDCTVLDHDKSADHVIKDLADAEAIHRQALLHQMNQKQVSLVQIQCSVKQMEQELSQLIAAKEITVGNINEFIQLAHKKLEERREMLIKNYEQQLNYIQNTWLRKQDVLQNRIVTLSNNLNQAEKLLKNGTLNEVITMNQHLAGTTEEMQSDFDEVDFRRKLISLDPKKGCESFENSLCNLGEITVFMPAKFEFKCKEAASAGKRVVMQVEVFSHNGEAVPVIAGNFTVEITDPENTPIQCTLNTAISECIVTFTPQMSGLHAVSVSFNGQRLKNARNQLAVRSNDQVLKFGHKGNGKGHFYLPCGIAIDSDNCLYVADTGNGLIQKFTADGEFLSQFMAKVGDKGLDDIAIDMNAELLFCILESSNTSPIFDGGNTLLAFNLEGVLQHTYTLYSVSNALSITINKQGEIILSDQGHQCLCKFDQDAKFLCYIGDLKFPGNIAITEDDCMIVPDHDSDCIYIFSPDGSVKHKFGSSGTQKGQLLQPWGVATDEEFILVGEIGNKRIQVFQFDGSFVSMIESIKDPISYPRALNVTKDGHVYVTDSGSHCIRKYKYRDMPWQQACKNQTEKSGRDLNS